MQLVLHEATKQTLIVFPALRRDAHNEASLPTTINPYLLMCHGFYPIGNYMNRIAFTRVYARAMLVEWSR